MHPGAQAVYEYINFIMTFIQLPNMYMTTCACHMTIIEKMAEQRATVELRCTVCLELFKEPKLLPCCHTFCKSCLEGILERSEVKEKLVCPQCRGEHEVDSYKDTWYTHML